MGKSIITIFALAIVVAGSAVFVISKNSDRLTMTVQEMKVVQIAAVEVIPTPTIEAIVQNTPFPTKPLTSTPSPTVVKTLEFQSSNYDSPDGTKTLMLKKIKDNKKDSYTATVLDKESNVNIEIFTNLQITYQGFVIPYNTWSPDNLYFFLKDVSSGFDSNYLVFNSTDKTFTDGVQSLDIKKYFDESLAERYYLEDVTGWAAPYLLIVNTRDKNDADGPSFWFDITSNSFIQLSTRFK